MTNEKVISKMLKKIKFKRPQTQHTHNKKLRQSINIDL